MNIYKKDSEILVSLNGCPDGWQNLGFDPLITDENKTFVTGFANGKATFNVPAKNAKIVSDKNIEITRLKSEILVYAEEISEEGVSYLNKTFQARENDLNRMNLAISKVSLGGSFVGAWRAIDNSWVVMTIEQLTALALLAAAHWEDTFKKSRILIDSLSSLALEDLKNYDIEVAWNALP